MAAKIGKSTTMNLDLNPETMKSMHEDDSLIDANNKPSTQNDRPSVPKSQSYIELYWENISVVATHLKTKKKTEILKGINGRSKSGDLTSIIGPSGCGKTTLLNLLSGRLFSKNLSLFGNIKVNGHDCNDMSKIGDKIAYVMQDDILCPVFTPKEAFMFAANLRLQGMTIQQKEQKVQDLLISLGLQKCQDTMIGNEMIRGVSGGEKKRTSIGVELLTDPYLLFLDEPTTGLDSSTAQNVLELLKKLAQQGMNVVQTIHQPSSQIFQLFDQLILMVEGNVIYQGKAEQSIDYFGRIGFQCPQFYNPSDYLMKCMNIEGLQIDQIKQGIELDDYDTLVKQFNERVTTMVVEYKNSQQYQDVRPEYVSPQEHHNSLCEHTRLAPQMMQFRMLLWRNLTVYLKDKFAMLVTLFQNVVIGCIILVIFNNLDEGQRGIDNRTGLLFFVCVTCIFQGVLQTISIFARELPLYLREIRNKSYNIFPYYVCKVALQLPFTAFLALVFTCIVYLGTGLSLAEAKGILIFYLVYLISVTCSQAYGQVLAISLENPILVSGLVPLLVVPQMLFSGFFLNLNDNNIPIFKLFEYLSIVKYQFQALQYNEFSLKKFVCKTDCDPIRDKDFDLTLWQNVLVLFIYTILLFNLSHYILRVKSNPKALNINDPREKEKYMADDKNGKSKTIDTKQIELVENEQQK